MGAGLGQAGPRKGVLRKPRPRQSWAKKDVLGRKLWHGGGLGWLGKLGWERCPGTVGFQAVTQTAEWNLRLPLLSSLSCLLPASESSF